MEEKYTSGKKGRMPEETPAPGKKDRGIRRTHTPEKKGRKRSRKRRLKFLLFFELLFVVVLLGIVGLVTKVDSIENHELEHVTVNDFTDENIDDYTNIAIFGVDSRANDLKKNTRSDAIIVASIHKKTKKVKLMSVYRDTYVHIEGHGYTKINHAYAYGGPDLAVNTLNENLDLNIQDFVTVNFSALTNVIDDLGGITLNIKEEELEYVNAYTRDVARINGMKYKYIKSAGKQKVSGVQATGYCRVRYTAGGDYTRAKRQRTVIKAILKKAKKSNPKVLYDVMNSLLPQIYTSLSTSDILSLMLPVFFYKIDNSAGFPYELEGRNIDGMFVNVPKTLSSNVKKMHRKLFGTKEFEPSDTVSLYSSEIGSR